MSTSKLHRWRRALNAEIRVTALSSMKLFLTHKQGDHVYAAATLNA
jgi:hypothetical protein